jgi:hypothetical protein
VVTFDDPATLPLAAFTTRASTQGGTVLLDVSDSLWTGPEWAMKPLSIRELKRATLMYKLICNETVQIL